MSLVTAKSDSTCPCCSEAHKLASCTQFKSWSVEDRTRWTRDHRLCFICFSVDHWVPQCEIKPNCNKCSRNHHFLLHNADDERRSKRETPTVSASLCASVRRPPTSLATSVVLGTALIHVRDRSGSWQTMRALVDCASQISAITVAGADRLGLKRSRWTTPISDLAGVPVVNVQGRVECMVQPRFALEPVLCVHAWVLPTITGDLPKQALSSHIKDCYSNLALADPSLNVTSPIDFLLGGDIYASIMDGRKVSIDANLPFTFSSIFGWILFGPVSDGQRHPYQSLPVSLTVSIESLMEQFWYVDEPATAPESFTVNGQCEQIFFDEVIRLSSGRFAVPLPLVGFSRNVCWLPYRCRATL